MRTLFVVAGFLFSAMVLPSNGVGQEVTGSTHRAHVVGGDTLPIIDLQPVLFFAPRVFTSRSEEMRYYRLVHNVKRAYPYAYLAGVKLREYEDQLAAMDSEADRRKAIRKIETEIREQFEEDLKRLTRTQGLILIKLVDRETSQTSYDLLRDFRGMVSAVFWQSLARLFGYNLKTRYDPQGEDHLIEQIVIMIEAGAI
ncbi:MAG: DUF4294 domain-containing protein [Bacteroidales bacterium]